MPSRLFKIASEATRRRARQAFSRTAVGRLVNRLRRQSRPSKALQTVVYNMTTPEGRKLFREIERAGGQLDKYGAKEKLKTAVDSILGILGPVGQLIRSVIGANKGRTLADDQLEAATELIRAYGGEVLAKPGQRGFDRGVEAAKEILEQTGAAPPVYRVPRGGVLDKSGPNAAPDLRATPDTGQPHATDDDWPDEHTIQLLGRGPIGYDEKEMRNLVTRERRVQSSNVYSYVFHPETARHGILYVTFLAWHPGAKSRSGPGATYAYYDVPVSIYRRFESAASSSAGRAVWDYLRIRGTIYGHQYQYRLVGGSIIPEGEGGGEYVPRKATAAGWKQRALPGYGSGRRTFQRSTLPERKLRARPAPLNRGNPKTGRT